MTVYRYRKKWRAQVFLNGERVASKSGFERKSDADAWHDEIVSQHRRGDVAAKAIEYRFDELLERFEKFHLPTLSRGTQVRYLVEIDNRIRPHFRFYPLHKISPEMLEAFKADVREKLSPPSANFCLETLRLIFNKAVKWRWLKESPWNIDLFKEPKLTYPWWEDKSHIVSFLQTAKERSKYYPVYLLALETGMRYGECVGLWKEDVDLSQGRLLVQRQWLQTLRCYGMPKNDKTRWIDFNPEGELASMLRRAVETSRHPNLVFPSAGERELGYNLVAQKVFKSLQRRAGVPEIGFHDLRHTFASHYMREHDSIWDLQAILGHADVKMTMRYAHQSKRSRRKPLGMSELLVTHTSLTASGVRLASSGGN